MALGDLKELLARIESRIKAGQKARQRTRQNEARRRQTANGATGRAKQLAASQEPDMIELIDLSEELPYANRSMTSYAGDPNLEEILICQYLPKDKSDTGDPDTPPIPTISSTSARPGTSQKIDVLRLRFEANQELWHPSDATDLDKIVKQTSRSRLL